MSSYATSNSFLTRGAQSMSLLQALMFSVFVKGGIARSTPISIGHGNNYEINAAVVRKPCHLGNPTTFVATYGSI
jgi:hypothetical protein